MGEVWHMSTNTKGVVIGADFITSASTHSPLVHDFNYLPNLDELARTQGVRTLDWGEVMRASYDFCDCGVERECLYHFDWDHDPAED